MRNDPFEPTYDSNFSLYKNEMIKLMDNSKHCNTESIIEYLKSKKADYRWDLFCWLLGNYSFSNKDQCRLFKFVWIFGNPDIRIILVFSDIDRPLLMDNSELEDLDSLPDEIKVYKAVPLDYMEPDDEDWNPSLDWKWSMNLDKVAYIAHCMGIDYIVISTTIPKSQVLALFHGIYFSYELIAIANIGEFDDYTIEIDDVDSYLSNHPYHHIPITEENIYRSTGF